MYIPISVWYQVLLVDLERLSTKTTYSYLLLFSALAMTLFHQYALFDNVIKHHLVILDAYFFYLYKTTSGQRKLSDIFSLYQKCLLSFSKKPVYTLPRPEAGSFLNFLNLNHILNFFTMCAPQIFHMSCCRHAAF